MDRLAERMPRRGPLLVGAVALLLATLALGSPALASHVSCGDTITQDTTLDSDLVDCPEDGLLIGADGITLNLNGHTIDGRGPSSRFGVLGGEHKRVTIENGVVQQFHSGVVFISLTGTFDGYDLVRRLLTRDITLDNRSFGGIDFIGSNYNRVEDNVTQRIFLDASRGSRISGNRGEIVVAEGEGNEVLANEGSIFVRDTRDNLIAGNRFTGERAVYLLSAEANVIEDNSISGVVGVVLERANDNVIKRNVLTDAQIGLVTVAFSHTNLIEKNSFASNVRGISSQSGVDAFSGNRIQKNSFVRNGAAITLDEGSINAEVVANDVSGGQTGIEVQGNIFSPARNNLIARNRISGAAGGGIVVDSFSVGTVIRRNVTNENAVDGIAVRVPDATVIHNTANRNGQLGIRAVPGVIDGGGNRASGNGDPVQCLNITCR